MGAVNLSQCRCRSQGTNDDGSSTLTTRDIGTNPRECGGRQLQVGDRQFFYFRRGDPPPQFDQGAEGYVGQHKGMLQVLFERGKYVDGMTADGEKDNYVPENPDAWQPTDLIIRNEELDNGEMKLSLYLILLAHSLL